METRVKHKRPAYYRTNAQRAQRRKDKRASTKTRRSHDAHRNPEVK